MPEDLGPRLTKATIRDLTAVRSRALANELTRRPHVALALLVAALAAQQAHGRLPGVGISAQMRSVADGTAADVLPVEGAFAHCVERSTGALLQALAQLMAQTLDFEHEDAGPTDRRLQQSADALAVALDLDMARHWKADATFWLAAPKALMLDALAGAPAIEALPDAEKTAALGALARMKKGELAAATAQAFEGVGWLPNFLVTPNGRGALALTDAGAAAIGADAAA